MKGLIAAAILAIAALAGCQTTPQNPAQAVYAAHGTYTVALTAAVQYKRLPPCAPAVKNIPCSNQAVVADLQKADDTAYAALSVAQRLVRGNESPTAMAQAIDAAVRAVRAFASIAQRLGSQP